MEYFRKCFLKFHLCILPLLFGVMAFTHFLIALFFFFFFTLPLPLVTRKATLPLYLSHSKIFLDSLSLDPVHMPSHTLQLTYIPFGLYVQNNCYLYSYMDIMSEDVYVCICVHGKKGIQ